MGDIKEFKGRIDIKYIEEFIDNLSDEDFLKLLGLSDTTEIENSVGEIYDFEMVDPSYLYHNNINKEE